MNIQKQAKEVAEATDNNQHTTARLLIAEYVAYKHKHIVGIKKLTKQMEAVETLQDFYKYMPDNLTRIRNDLEVAIFSFLNEEETTIFNDSL